MCESVYVYTYMYHSLLCTVYHLFIKFSKTFTLDLPLFTLTNRLTQCILTVIELLVYVAHWNMCAYPSVFLH